MDTEIGLSRFFVSQEVGIAFVLLLIFPALSYFALSVVPSFLPGSNSGIVSWVIALVVLYLEAVMVAALYRTVFR